MVRGSITTLRVTADIILVMTAAKVRIPTVITPLRPSTVPIVLLSTSTAATVPPVAVM